MEYIEFSPHIGCPINCSKYCIQDRINKNYDGKRMLSFDNFKTFLSTVPSNIGVCFAGYSEPFINPDLVDMIEYVNRKGHRQGVFTTLFNVSKEQILQISKINFHTFVVHLPDGKHNKMPYSPEWGETLYTVATSIPSATYMSMNDTFVSLGREHLHDTKKLRYKRWGFCNGSGLFVDPNGDVYPCSMVVGLPNLVIGNLHDDSYAELRKRHSSYFPYHICHYCSQYVGLIARALKWVKTFV